MFLSFLHVHRHSYLFFFICFVSFFSTLQNECIFRFFLYFYIYIYKYCCLLVVCMCMCVCVFICINYLSLNVHCIHSQFKILLDEAFLFFQWLNIIFKFCWSQKKWQKKQMRNIKRNKRFQVIRMINECGLDLPWQVFCVNVFVFFLISVCVFHNMLMLSGKHNVTEYVLVYTFSKINRFTFRCFRFHFKFPKIKRM